MTTLFVSDLHLYASRPAVTDCFLRFLTDTASQADALYILGDLFESWIGDDAPGVTGVQVSGALRSLVNRGVPCQLHAWQPRFPDCTALCRGKRHQAC